jgi:hypothetical protein
MNEMLRRRAMMRAGTSYSDLTYNKAWNSSNGGEHQSGPIDADGFAITPFLELTWQSGMSVTVKAGYTTRADYAGGCIAFKTDLSLSVTTTAYLQSSDPRTVSATGRYIYISATFKMSELDDCYIYDNKSRKYLWAGRNIDTSVAP